MGLRRLLVAIAVLAALCALPAQAFAGEMQTQATGSLSVTTKVTYDLYTGDPGTTQSITVKNTGSATVSNVRLVRMTENKATTTKGNSRAVGYRWNDSGDISNPLGWLWLEKDYPCDTTDISLGPGESVTFPLRAYVDYHLADGEWFPAPTTIADTIQVSADGATTKSITSTVKVTNPASAPFSIGTFQAAGWNLTKFGSINLGSIQAGTQYNNGNGYAFGVKNESNALTDNPIYRIVSAKIVKAHESDPDIFSLWGPGRSQLIGNADAWSTAAFNLQADATFLPAGTYKATLVLGVSPGNMVVNGGKYSTIKVDQSACTVSVPVQVKVTGANPNLPAKVQNLKAEAGDGYVYLNWDKVGGSNDGYQVWRSDLGFDEPLATVYSANDTHFTDTTVANGRTYTYYVSGYMQYSEKSDPVSVTPKAGVAGRMAAPYLIDTDSEDHAVRLKWSLSDPRDRGDGLERVAEAWNSETEENESVSLGMNSPVSHFVVYMDGKAVACVSQAVVREADGSWEDVELPDGSTSEVYVPRYRWEDVVPVDAPYIDHQFTVAAVDAVTGLEGYPSNACMDFADGEESFVYDFVPTYTMLSDGVEFTFLSSYDYADSATYSVYRKKDGGDETAVKSGLKASLEGTTYADRPAGNGTYVYRVKRVEGGEAQWSFPVTFVKKDYNLVVPPGAPTLVTDEEAAQFSRGGSHRVQLVWNPPATGGPVDHYVVYRTNSDDVDIADLNLGDSSGIDKVAEVPAGTTTYLDANVWPSAADSTVCYLVRAVNAAGESTNTAWTKIACEDDVDWADAAPGKPTITKLEIVKQWDGWWDGDDWAEGEADALRVEWASGSGGEASEWEVWLRRPGDWDYSSGEMYYDSSVRSHTFEASYLRDSFTGEAVNGTYSVKVVARNSKGAAEAAATYTRGEVDARPRAPRLEIPYRDPANYQPSIKLLASPGDDDPWAGSVTSFKVWRSRSQDGVYEQVGSVDVVGGEFPAVFFDTEFPQYATALNSLSSGLYWYKVSAVNGEGESDRSEAVCWYAYKPNEIGQAVGAVEGAVGDLPSPDDLTVENYAEHAAAIAEANEALGNLPEGQRALIDPELQAKLAALVAKAAALQKDAADIIAANEVAGQVGELPDVNALALSDRAAVEAARAAYDALTDEQLARLDDGVLAALEAAEARIEALQKEADDQVAADAVVSAINGLPALDGLTLTDAHAVASARLAYGALTEEQEALFGSGERAAALVRLAELEARIEQMQQALEAVMAALGGLPLRNAVTTAVGGNVQVARAAYDALPPSSQELVGDALVARLVDAEERLAELADQAAANEVILLINSLPAAGELVVGNEGLVQAARAAYAALSADQKALVVNAAALVAAEARIAELTAPPDPENPLDPGDPLTPEEEAAVQEVVETIAAIGEIEDDGEETRAKVEEARAAYNALTDEQKALVDVADLAAAEARISEIEKQHVRDLVDELGDAAQLTEYDLARVQSVREAFNALTEKQRSELADVGQALEAMEDAIAGCINEAAAEPVRDAITALPTSERLCAADLATLRSARAAYDALTENQKVLVTNYYRLATAEELMAEIVDLNNAVITGVSNKTYTGKALTQAPTITDKAGTVLKADADYKLTYSGNTNAGTATMKVTGLGNYAGSTASRTFVINKASIAKATLTNVWNLTYSGKALAQSPTLVFNGATLKLKTAYTLSYLNSKKKSVTPKAVGAYYVRIKGTGNFTGSRDVAFKVTTADKSLAKAVVTGVKAKTYNGKAQTQAPTVKLAGKALKLNRDYKLIYAKNVNAGTATVTVRGIGNYSGAKAAKFTIAKAANPMRVAVKAKSVNYSDVKGKNVPVTGAYVVTKAQGKVTYARVAKGSAACLTINKTTGAITVKKGAKKGTYSLVTKITAAGTANYKAAAKTLTVRITVK